MKLKIIILCTLLSVKLLSQEAFITTWNTENRGDSNNKSITIPTKGDRYNYDVD